jgi:hypothetical protein
MLQAHSFLWNYLWIAPNVLLLGLAVVLWKRGIWRKFPGFFAFCIVNALGVLAEYAADVLPSVSGVNYWRVAWACLLIESLVKFTAIGEVFSRVLNPFPSVSRLGRIFVSGGGAALVFVATLVAAFSRGDSTVRLISGYHLLAQTVYFVELGLVVIIFLFVAYFGLSWDRLSFGVLLGFGISSCEYLASWAILANADPSAQGRTLLDLLNMATFHLCVLLWGYYLLVPSKVRAKPVVSLPQHNLEVWNRELERLIHQ